MTRVSGRPATKAPPKLSSSAASPSSKRTEVTVRSAASVSDKLGTAVRFRTVSALPQYLASAMLECATALPKPIM